MKVFWFLLLLCLAQRNSGSIEEDLKKVLDLSDDPKCIFNYTEVTSQTIQFFPKCSKVYGILVINSNSDLNLTQLKNAVKNMSSLVGGIRIENSSLTSLSFLTPGAKSKAFSLSCKNYGVYINNNQNLNNATMLEKIGPIEDEDFNDCNVEITQNPMLSMTDPDLCYSYFLGNMVNLRTEGNMENCGCQGSPITSSSLSRMQNCLELYNGLVLYNFTESQNLSALSNVTFIKGNIDIQNSNLQNLSFLANVKYSTVYAREGEVNFNLQNNSQMTRFGLSMLERMDNAKYNTPKIGNIENLHPDFCLSLSDFYLFHLIELTFKNLHAKLCDEFDEDIDQMCKFVSMEELEIGCKTILGNIVIDSGDEEHTGKLNGTICLFGTLTIKNTNLEDLKFLSRMLFIAVLEDTTQPVIQIVGNQNLTNPQIGRFFSNLFTRKFENRYALIQDNSPDIWNSTEGDCNVFGTSTDEMQKYRRGLNYTGGDCGERVDPKSDSPSFLDIWVLLALLFFKF